MPASADGPGSVLPSKAKPKEASISPATGDVEEELTSNFTTSPTTTFNVYSSAYSAYSAYSPLIIGQAAIPSPGVTVSVPDIVGSQTIKYISPHAIVAVLSPRFATCGLSKLPSGPEGAGVSPPADSATVTITL